MEALQRNCRSQGATELKGVWSCVKLVTSIEGAAEETIEGGDWIANAVVEYSCRNPNQLL
jgi:hypothetical protein